ncbi:hypothetical protein B0H10DRAFT_563532 [Mycena sp. CBHHK59/15]|nr:hypothetical protein B0H10DRAFT_563532 [Mycena sp. CBHHK59/15]
MVADLILDQRPQGMTSARRVGKPIRSKVTVSAESIVDLSKSAVVPLKCDAMVLSDREGAMVMCGQELCCWKALYKHQLKHCGIRKTQNGGINYTCRLSKCSAKIHTTYSSFKSHVELSHMKNISLPCPFTNCAPVIPDFGRPAMFNTFGRPRDLITHVEDLHPNLLGSELDMHSDILLPRWEPHRPARPLPVPPALPPSASIQPGAFLLPPSPSAPRGASPIPAPRPSRAPTRPSHPRGARCYVRPPPCAHRRRRRPVCSNTTTSWTSRP